ncbi:hypothetical protein N9571_00780 [Yoonia sp.]|uniref:hypothetical protein n=1 Tax=Yoonia sp. TaxID=2212373 RepID=UPI002375EBF6|nr:hypothetical protein [Yoonia sp.]MDB4111082.1 hypothetical protein [Yoonia sp.]
MTLTMHQMVDEVRAALADKLRVRGWSLAVQVRKAGRRLPRAVRRDAVYLVQTIGLVDNPKLARMIDMRRAQLAHRNILAFLETVDVAAERRGIALQIAASIALVLLVTGLLLLFVLVQRGFV